MGKYKHTILLSRQGHDILLEEDGDFLRELFAKCENSSCISGVRFYFNSDELYIALLSRTREIIRRRQDAGL